ncbi:unnamed protein product, partial [Sphenostylis stenocarpa]
MLQSLRISRLGSGKETTFILGDATRTKLPTPPFSAIRSTALQTLKFCKMRETSSVISKNSLALAKPQKDYLGNAKYYNE